MATKRQAVSGFDDEPEVQENGQPKSKPAGKKTSDSKVSRQGQKVDKPDGIHEGVMVYGSIVFNPMCPACTDEKNSKYVMMNVTSCQGPLVYVKCPECENKTKVTRPIARASAVFQKQQSVAARSDME